MTEGCKLRDAHKAYSDPDIIQMKQSACEAQIRARRLPEDALLCI